MLCRGYQRCCNSIGHSNMEAGRKKGSDHGKEWPLRYSSPDADPRVHSREKRKKRYSTETPACTPHQEGGESSDIPFPSKLMKVPSCVWRRELCNEFSHKLESFSPGVKEGLQLLPLGMRMWRHARMVKSQGNNQLHCQHL